MKKGLKKISLLLLLLFILAGCTNKKEAEEKNEKEEQYILGGDICNYGVVLEESKTQLVTFPIITNIKIDSIELKSVRLSEDADIKFELTNFEGKEDLKYKDQHIYLLLLNIENKDEKSAFFTLVESAEILVNGSEFTYPFKDFKLCSAEYLCEKENSSIKEQSMLFDGGTTGLFGYVPDSQRPLNFSITVDEDYNIDSFYFFGNYLEKEKTLISGQACYDESIDLPLRKNGTMTMETSFVNEDFTESEIIRDAFIIKYSDDKESYLFIHNGGLYIWRNYNELGEDVNGVLKNYIDKYVVN